MARRLIAVRDNEVAAGSMGIPVVRTKLLAFALSGFMAGYAGVCFAFATERFSTDTFDPTVSILVISMVVIGGLGSIAGARPRRRLPGRAARHLRHHLHDPVPHQRLGLMAFILYLPGGLAELMHRPGTWSPTAGLAARGGADRGRRAAAPAGPVRAPWPSLVVETGR